MVATLCGKTLDANAVEEVKAAAKPIASTLLTMKQREMNTDPEGALSRNLFIPREGRVIFKKMYDDYMLCKVTLGVLKGASKLNVLLLFIIIILEDVARTSTSSCPITLSLTLTVDDCFAFFKEKWMNICR